VQCERCKLRIDQAGRTCPGCGALLNNSSSTSEEERDYYGLFDLSPHMSYSEIRARLAQASRLWVNRANNANLEKRQEAERMLQYVSEAEAVLLKSSTRSAYDAKWRQRQGDSTYSARAASSGSAGSSTRHASTPEDRSETSARPAVVIPWRTTSPVPTAESGGETTQESQSEDSGTTQTNWLGWTELRGTVIHVDPIYTATPPVNWSRVLLALVLFPVAAMVAAFLFAFWLVCSFMFPRFARSMNISNLLLLLVLQRAGGPRSQSPVRDIRVRDRAGTEHFVRIIGQFVSGSVNVGDDVTLAGFCRGGTLRARRGINHRTRSVIKVRV
jgi:hypothetical protein